jgi:hypothetical protein
VCAGGADPALLGGPSTSPLDGNIHMKYSDFRIGLEFWCGEKRWRCTDVGTRTIAAISLEPHEVVELSSPRESSKTPRTRRYVTTDPSWLSGPPYQVPEAVFDEYDIEGCSLTQEGRQGGERVAV